MKDEGKTATKKTVTTTTVPAATATAVPVGSADDAGEVTAPRCLIISIVVLDAIALLFWLLTLVPLGFLGLVCAIIASILACVVPFQDADDEFSKSITTVMWVHIAFGACYIVGVALTASTALNAGLVGAAWAFMIITLILLIVCLVMASILLCKINKKR